MKLYFQSPARGGWDAAARFSAQVQCLHRPVPGREIPGQRLFADGAPILANRRVEAGQVISFELPPEGGGRCAAGRHSGGCGLRGRFRPRGGKAAPSRGASYPELPAGYAGERLCRLGAASGQKPRLPPGEPHRQGHQRPRAGGSECYAAPLLAQRVEKLYYAVAEGELPLGPGVIDAPIGRQGRASSGGASPPTANPAGRNIPY